MIAWIKGYARGLTLLVLLAAVAAVAAGFSGSPQGTGQSFTPPTNVAATSSGDTITVSWTPGAGASSQVIVAVNVVDDTDYCLGFDATGSASSHECPGLSISATYVVLVIALDGAGGYRLGRDAQGNLVTHTLVSVPVSQAVGAGAAATVAHDSGALIEVPAGATSEATTVSITEVPPPDSDLDVGRVFDFSVGDVELAKPITLHIPYRLPASQPTGLLYAVHWDEDAGEWERVDATVDAAAGVMVVTTSDLSFLSVALVSVDATCSMEDRDPNDPNSITMTASITSHTRFAITVFMAPEAQETTRNVNFFNKSGVRTDSGTLSHNETMTFPETFILRYAGEYELRCHIFWEYLGYDVELETGDQAIVGIDVSQNATPDKDFSELNECASFYTDPVTGKTTRSDANARTVLQGESLEFRANGFAEGETSSTPYNTPHLVATISGHYHGELLDQGIGRNKALTTGNVPSTSLPLATTSFTFSEVGEYTIDCALWWFADDPKIPDFSNEPNESIKDLLQCIFDGAACLGYLRVLRDVKTVTVTAAPALWSQRPMEIIPSQIPSQGGNREVTIRVYIQESALYSDRELVPTITAVLPAGLDGSRAGSRLTPEVSSCDFTEDPGYYETCWKAVFENIPENTSHALVDQQGEITDPNNAEVRIEVTANRDISGTAPSGSFSILGRSPYSSDRKPLEVLYRETGGEFFWRTKDHWIEDTDIHEWYGVNDFRLLTDAEKAAKQVTSLELNDNNLRGDLPAEVGYLTSLKFLILAANDNLEGQIPGSLGELTNLEYLDLSGNGLSRQIPSTLGNLKNLKLLDLSDNNLIGEIPSNFDELPELRSLYLADNRLTGCIPAGLRDLRNDDFNEMDLPFCDVALSALTISPGELEPEFETHTMDYSATVDQSRVAIFPVNDHAATFEYYVGSSRTPATDADSGFQVDLGCGETTVRIKVISADEEEDDTYTIEFTRGGVGLPAAPTIRSVSRGTGSLTVSWNAPDTTCGGTIDRYNLRYSLDQDDAAWTEVQGPSSGLSHTVSGLSADTTYRVQAQAVNEHGAGPWSGTFVASTASESNRDTVTQGNPDLVVDSPALGIPAPGSLEPGGVVYAEHHRAQPGRQCVSRRHPTILPLDG